MKTSYLSLAAAAALFAAPALADHDDCAPQRDDDNQDNQVQPAQPSFVTRDDGHYELRTFQTWEEGRYQPVWVAGACFGGRPQVCQPGDYRQDWVPGHYAEAQQYVWVESRHHHHHGWGRFNSRRW